MQTYTLKIENDKIAEKVLWLLKYFEKDGVVIKKEEESIRASLKRSFEELNDIREGKLEAKDIGELLGTL